MPWDSIQYWDTSEGYTSIWDEEQEPEHCVVCLENAEERLCTVCTARIHRSCFRKFLNAEIPNPGYGAYNCPIGKNPVRQPFAWLVADNCEGPEDDNEQEWKKRCIRAEEDSLFGGSDDDKEWFE